MSKRWIPITYFSHADYGIDRWVDLTEYTPEEDIRQTLKTLNRQYNQYIKVKVMLKNNLIALLDQTFPDANRLFNSTARKDGHEKWVDFSAAFWHCKCVSDISENAFSERYAKWCKKHRYNYSPVKPRCVCCALLRSAENEKSR